MAEPMQIAEIVQTCSRSPSQWEGRLTDGRPFYIRYRWGRLSVSFGRPGGTLEEAVLAGEWFDEQIGDPLDGEIELDEVCRRTGLVMSGVQEPGSI
ncbi:hypothetical protein KXR53_34615 [Inquilinus limosus]|uniref:hypothetical protein n=1 Tax=Inquilinus limosus TaxID=171674 RepID=UPI003F164A37